jgi:hypothetical protein
MPDVVLANPYVPGESQFYGVDFWGGSLGTDEIGDSGEGDRDSGLIVISIPE